METYTPLVMSACFELNLCILNIGFIVIVVVRRFRPFRNSSGMWNL